MGKTERADRIRGGWFSKHGEQHKSHRAHSGGSGKCGEQPSSPPVPTPAPTYPTTQPEHTASVCHGSPVTCRGDGAWERWEKFWRGEELRRRQREAWGPGDGWTPLGFQGRVWEVETEEMAIERAALPPLVTASYPRRGLGDPACITCAGLWVLEAFWSI